MATRMTAMSPSATLSTNAERLDKDRVRVRVEVPEDELDPALDAAYKRWSRDI